VFRRILSFLGAGFVLNPEAVSNATINTERKRDEYPNKFNACF
jgi:hypothetical protein